MLNATKFRGPVKKFILSIFFTCIVFSSFNLHDAYAQDNSKQLVFTKTMIDKKTSQVWFEVFNPSDEDIILSSFRISGVKTPNILPADILRKKGVTVKPAERLIICGDKQSFENTYGSKIKIIEIKMLKDIGDGGFIAMNHMGGIENSNNIIRFGQREKSLLVSGKVSDDQLLNFTDDGMCYAREVKSDGKLALWTKATPNPGKN